MVFTFGTFLEHSKERNPVLSFFFYVGFLSQTFTINRTAGEGGGYLFNSSRISRPTSQTLRH